MAESENMETEKVEKTEEIPFVLPEKPAAEDVARALYALAFAPEGSALAPKAADRLRALELLGRHLGMFSAEGAAEREGVTILDDVR